MPQACANPQFAIPATLLAKRGASDSTQPPKHMKLNRLSDKSSRDDYKCNVAPLLNIWTGNSRSTGFPQDTRQTVAILT